MTATPSFITSAMLSLMTVVLSFIKSVMLNHSTVSAPSFTLMDVPNIVLIKVPSRTIPLIVVQSFSSVRPCRTLFLFVQSFSMVNVPSFVLIDKPSHSSDQIRPSRAKLWWFCRTLISIAVQIFIAVQSFIITVPNYTLGSIRLCKALYTDKRLPPFFCTRYPRSVLCRSSSLVMPSHVQCPVLWFLHVWVFLNMPMYFRYTQHYINIICTLIKTVRERLQGLVIIKIKMWS